MSEGSYLITRDTDRQRSWPSPAFKLRYRKTRERMGLQPRHTYPHLSKHTTLCWKFEEFEKNVAWVWDRYLEHTQEGVAHKGLVMAHLIGKTFGIAMRDLRGDCRDQTISVPRQIGMALLRKDGIAYPHIRKAFHKDPKSAAYAAEQMMKYTEKLHERVGGRGHPSISQSTGRVQTRFPEVATEDGEDDQA
jgi:hypothetical protein